MKKIHCHIILTDNNASWIMEKIAHRLFDGIHQRSVELGVKVTLGNQPDPFADVNHWMSYAFANVQHNTLTTMLITHLDDEYKINLVTKEIRNGVNVGICLSSHTRNILIEHGSDEDALTYVVPGHDFVAKPRRIVVGLTTRVYSDGRKREYMLSKLSSRISLHDFRFEIFGDGWEKVIPHLKAAGAEVLHFPGSDDYVGDYEEIARHLPGFDYYLYLGRDEGSLGTLDALAAGVETIVTPQGFHCDLPGGITYSVWDYEELEAVFRSIVDRRRRLTGSADLASWDEYARRHCLIWRMLVEDRRSEITTALRSDKGDPQQVAARYESKWVYFARRFNIVRIRSAVSHLPALRPLHRLWFAIRGHRK